jgi:hypothetical protein
MIILVVIVGIALLIPLLLILLAGGLALAVRKAVRGRRAFGRGRGGSHVAGRARQRYSQGT